MPINAYVLEAVRTLRDGRSLRYPVVPLVHVRGGSSQRNRHPGRYRLRAAIHGHGVAEGRKCSKAAVGASDMPRMMTCYHVKSADTQLLFHSIMKYYLWHIARSCFNIAPECILLQQIINPDNMKRSNLRVALLAVLVTVAVITMTSCNKGYGCPTNFSVSQSSK